MKVHRLALLCVTLVPGLLWPVTGSVSAQEIRGRVLDVTTEEPLAAAVVSVVGGDSTLLAMTLSDSTGAFLLRVPESGIGRLRVERLGYTTVESLPLDLAHLGAVPLEARLQPHPIELEGVTATARLRFNRNLEGFLRRQTHGFGRYAGPAKIAAMKPVDASQVLWHLSTRLMPDPDGGVRARAFRSGPYCYPRIYVDRNLINDRNSEGQPVAAQLDFHLSPQSIRAVEVYDKPYQAPPYFQEPDMADCPVVVIWTDYGFGLGSGSIIDNR
jgi:hypothetical protein